MSLYLALDTATPFGSVALGTREQLLAELLIGDRRHAAATAGAIEELLAMAGKGWPDVEGVVLADGPGSFTGLRIGFATAKGLIAARPSLQLRIAPSLMSTAFAAAAFFKGPIAAVYDALRGEVFAAVYSFEPEGVQEILAPSLTTPDALLALPVKPEVAIGDAAILYGDILARWTGKDAVPPPAGAPRAGALLSLLGVPGATQEIRDPGRLEPNYGRLAEAQRRWEAKHGRPLPGSGSYQR
ncbi:MAG: tRNA (adenosine(37)-N6)-threonylcarbamoyltransferase complex dimerization subunit type 1 TsaB [Gemmatimonadales bacterium]|nr:MAG: tRNA (adenosine(37)-N6)-threonylcarbamoyltransferase complex dimerization subunit type 1 TsaB [Gemmatimonadales bacterium]